MLLSPLFIYYALMFSINVVIRLNFVTSNRMVVLNLVNALSTLDRKERLALMLIHFDDMLVLQKERKGNVNIFCLVLLSR